MTGGAGPMTGGAGPMPGGAGPMTGGAGPMPGAALGYSISPSSSMSSLSYRPCGAESGESGSESAEVVSYMKSA